MKAMILAAGLGTRLRPLTYKMPKALIKIGQETLIERHIRRFVEAGIKDIVVNLAYHGDKIEKSLEHITQANIVFSKEPVGKYETGGGIVNALPLLGKDPFVVVSSDIWTDYDYKQLVNKKVTGLGHMVMIDRVTEKKEDALGLIKGQMTMGPKLYTYANIGLYRPELFSKEPLTFLPLREIIIKAIAAQKMTGEFFYGQWFNIGNYEELQLAKKVAKSAE